jgi:hypothetical protein
MDGDEIEGDAASQVVGDDVALRRLSSPGRGGLVGSNVGR